MTIDEYFGDWMKILDRGETMKIMGWLKTVDKETLCPSIRNVFKAFKLCPYNDCKVIFVGQDPYPQKGVAQGLAFSNSSNTSENKLSVSLRIIKESVINFDIPHNLITFDPTLESWARQGILLLNAALTTKEYCTKVHIKQWRPFMGTFLHNMSLKNPGLVYVLFGSYAAMLEPYINKDNSYIIKVEHPSYFSRTGKKMPSDMWNTINTILYGLYGNRIEWFKEEEFNQ